MKILKLENVEFDEVVDILNGGGVVTIPTDTIYGFTADAENIEAIDKIFKIKGRQGEKALPIFIESISEAEKLTEINSHQRKFLASVWPGKITCVLVAKNKGTIALRIPKHDFVLKLLREFGGPLIGTSANLSGKSSHTKISELIEEFKNRDIRPDIIIDAGDLPASKSSTIVDLTIWPPKILRAGAVSAEELLSYIK